MYEVLQRVVYIDVLFDLVTYISVSYIWKNTRTIVCNSVFSWMFVINIVDIVILVNLQEQ